MPSSEKEIEILENIYYSSSIKQRDLAEIAGLSLGMTNAIMKRLVTRGWLKMKKINNRNIRYAITPHGIEQIMRRSYRYFKRTIRNVVFYKERIDMIIADIKTKGYRGIMLVGASDLDFIVEHACRTHNIEYVRNEEEFSGKAYCIYAETYIPDNSRDKIEDRVFLQDVLIG